MNHLIISREYPPAPSGGGIGTYVHHIAELLAGHGETVHVIGQRWPGAPHALETRAGGRLIVHRVAVEDSRLDAATLGITDAAILRALRDPSVAGGFSCQAGQLAESLIDRGAVDIVEAQEYEAPTYTLMLRRVAGLGPSRRVPVLIHLHTPTEFALGANEWADDLVAHATVIELERAVIRAADAWLCPSRFLARIAESHYRLEPNAVEVIPYPMGDGDFIHRNQRTWRDGTIYYAGRLEPRKGVLEWIEAATLVIADVPARFTLIGRDTSPSSGGGGSVRTALLSRIPASMRRQFQFIDGVPRRRLVDHLAQARIAVVPSRWENFPNTCIEAMASGLPVLVSPSGGMAEMVEDGRTGWIASGSDAVSLATALRRALATPPDILASMGAAAAASIQVLCGNREIVRRQLEFRQLVAGLGCRQPAELSTMVPVVPDLSSSRRSSVAPRIAPGRTMTAFDVLRASPRQQLAVLHRALTNPSYVVQWLAWHRRRWFSKEP